MELCDHLSIASQTTVLDSAAYCDFTVEPTENEPYSTIFHRAADQKRCVYGDPAAVNTVWSERLTVGSTTEIINLIT